MRNLYLIIILLSICGNEIMLEYVTMDDPGVSYFELSTENQSEKEYEDHFEYDYFLNDQSLHFIDNNSTLNQNKESILQLNLFLEIHSPPPES